jgi:hypothetical protein
MATPRAAVSLETGVRTCQIIVAALIFGILPLLALSVVIGPLLTPRGGAAAAAGAGAGGPDNLMGPILTYTATGFGVLALVLSFILPGVISANARKTLVQGTQMQQPGVKTGKGSTVQSIEDQQGDLFPIYQMQLIAGAAVLEGAAFFAAAAHLLVGDPILLGVVVVLIGGFIGLFPTLARATRWIEQQQERLRDDGLNGHGSS